MVHGVNRHMTSITVKNGGENNLKARNRQISVIENGALKLRELFVVGRNGVCIMRTVHNSRVTQRSTPALKMHATVSVLFSERQKNTMCIYSKDVS